MNEKALLAKGRQPLPATKLDYAQTPSVVYSPTLNNVYLEADADMAFQMFLKEYPGVYIRLHELSSTETAFQNIA